MLTFDPDQHLYRLANRVVPSVTQVLKAMALTPDYSQIDPEILAHAAARGSFADQCADAYDAGTLDIEAVDPRARGYVEAWAKFRVETGFTPHDLPKLVYHPTLDYAGQFDSYGECAGTRWLIDRKCTSKVSPHYAIQLAAYQAALECGQEPVRVDRRVIVHLKPNGTYRLVPFESPSDAMVWHAAVTLYHYRKGVSDGI